MALSYLLAGLCVEQNPTQLNDLGRVLGHVHAVLVAGGRDVDDDVAVELGGGSLNGRHGEDPKAVVEPFLVVEGSGEIEVEVVEERSGESREQKTEPKPAPERSPRLPAQRSDDKRKRSKETTAKRARGLKVESGSRDEERDSRGEKMAAQEDTLRLDRWRRTARPTRTRRERQHRKITTDVQAVLDYAGARLFVIIIDNVKISE